MPSDCARGRSKGCSELFVAVVARDEEVEVLFQKWLRLGRTMRIDNEPWSKLSMGVSYI